MNFIKSYTDLKTPGSLGGRNVFSKGLGEKIDKKKLLNLPAYSLHFPRRKIFRRRKVFVPHINAQWGADLAEIQPLKSYNKGYRYILCVIDMFSKKAWMEPLKNKTGVEVSKAFEKILKRSHARPEKLQTDSGKEFLNTKFQNLLSQKKIIHFSVTSEIKCGTVERFIRTIMTKIRKYMTHHDTKKFINLLPQFESLYNNTYHRSIRMAPNEVNSENSPAVYRHLYGSEENLSQNKPKFSIGDRVRISKIKKTFEKGYETNFTEEVFTIARIGRTNPIMYYLKDDEGEEISGGFYMEELLKIPLSA